MVMDINQIMETIPHRQPFLLVDRIEELEPVSYTHLSVPPDPLQWETAIPQDLSDQAGIPELAGVLMKANQTVT